LLEFLAFGAVSAGVLYVQNKWGSKSDRQNDIDKFFRNAGIGVTARGKEGESQGIMFPKRLGSKEDEFGVTYSYRLPIGMTYKMLSTKYNLEDIFESMFNRDTQITEGTHNVVHITVYNERLPKEVPFQMEWFDLIKGYKVIIGKTHKKLIFHDFDKIPHMIIGGMTRYGKSVVMKLLIVQLLLKQQGVKFHLFDLKGGLAFNRFKKLPQVHSVSRDATESLKNLKNLRNEIKKRQLYFELKEYEDIKEAWAAGEYFDRDIIVVDEASVLAPQSKSDQVKNEIREILEFIAQVAGGLGYNLIMCSQYPTGDILPRQVKQNSDARLSFRLPTATASNVILDRSGAEDLPFQQPGRAIYATDGIMTVQVPYMNNDMIDELIKPLKVDVINANESAAPNGKRRKNLIVLEETTPTEPESDAEDAFFRQ